MALKGRTGGPMTVHRRPRGPKCKHVWTEWAKAGIFDSTEVRDCTKCGRHQTRRPSE